MGTCRALIVFPRARFLSRLRSRCLRGHSSLDVFDLMAVPGEIVRIWKEPASMLARGPARTSLRASRRSMLAVDSLVQTGRIGVAVEGRLPACGKG